MSGECDGCGEHCLECICGKLPDILDKARRSSTVTMGCVCPPGAERTCRGNLCPRQPIKF